MTLCAVVLAAGAGTRLKPLTARTPKALCPVANVTLLDRTLRRLAALGLDGPDDVAVNAHHHADQVVDAVEGRAHLSVERPEALGTAGAVANLRRWTDGRDVLVCNADAYLSSDDVGDLVTGWDGGLPRLLVVHQPARGDFGPWRFAGMSMLSAADAAKLEPVPTGLYEVLWRNVEPALAPYAGTFVDCGTPADYLDANLHASGGENLVGAGATVEGTLTASVVGAGATVLGDLTRSVVWPGATVHAGEHLVDTVRALPDLTVR